MTESSGFERTVRRWHVAVVVPAFRVENHIEDVLRSIPTWVRTIIVVDDGSPDQTGGGGTWGRRERLQDHGDRPPAEPGGRGIHENGIPGGA